jgi:putative tryptophan/tyrosine transport system substrate-binding protein
VTFDLNRRKFIAALGGAAACPLSAGAQQPTMPVIGFLSTGSLQSDAVRLTAVRRGLGEAGYADGRNVTIEYHGTQGQYDKLLGLAADLVRRQVAAIVAVATPALFAAKAATTTIPIVFSVSIDPVTSGIVASVSQPGGNMTGVLTAALGSKRLQLLHELVPDAAVVALLDNPTNQVTESETRQAEDAAHTLGLKLHVLRASTVSDIDVAFGTLAELRARALVVGVDPFFTNHSAEIVALAARCVVPAIYAWREFVDDGGLASYGTRLSDSYRQVGIYVGRILQGERPSDLPVQQVVRVELVINLKTAKTLGLTVPRTLLALADEVIE